MWADGQTHIKMQIGAFREDTNMPTNKYGGPAACTQKALLLD